MEWCGPNSTIGITICYGLCGLGIKYHVGKIIRTCPHRLWDPPSLLHNAYWVICIGKAAGA